MMLSAIVVFGLAFAAVGLLLGYAATYDVESDFKPPFRNGDSMNSTNITIEESVNVTVKRSTSG